MKEYDIAIVGGGPGGYVAAIRAAQLGAKTVLIEKDAIGGTCLNRGCIPTKALVASVSKLKELEHCTEFGLKADNVGYDFAAIMQRKNAVTKQLVQGVTSLVKGNGIECLYGNAVLQKDKIIKVQSADETVELKAKKIILATGSRPFLPPIEGIDLAGIMDSDALLEIDAVPESMVVVGGGVIGLEFAVIFQALGCQVTVVEMLPTILDCMDKDIITRVGPPLRKQGIKFMTSCKVQKFVQAEGKIAVAVETAKGEEQLLAEKVLVCTGRVPNVDGIGLEEAGINFNHKGIAINEKLESNVEGIYAIGDVTGKSMLAHAASTAGIVAVQNALGHDAIMDFSDIPACVFTLPELASVGLTEKEAVEAGVTVAVNKFNFAGNGKAIAIGETDGFVKIVADKNSHRVLGMHIMGPHASDLIMEGAVAVRNKLTVEQVAHTIHPHPTLSEVVMECAEGVFGEAIHQMKMGKKS